MWQSDDQADLTFIDEALARAEAALDAGRSVKGTGFWRAVAILRARPQLAARYADDVARIDRRAFEAGVKLRVPAWVGTTVLALGTTAGIVALVAAGRFDDPLRTVAFFAGLGLLVVCTHSLTHWVVGRAVGIRFTHVFLGGPPPPRPGVKTDYASYLRTAPRRRAVMHASGAVVTKLIPFALIPAAVALGLDTWVVVVLVGLGVVQILTDVFLSTKLSDWKKVGRELRAAKTVR